jgi:predicted amidophosphoribosyltransferase
MAGYRPPSFKMAKDELDECFRLIAERIAKARGKGLQLRQVSDGQMVVPVPLCTQCGKPVRESMKFCGECGNHL